MNEDLITTGQAAKKYDVTISYLRRLARQGRIEGVQKCEEARGTTWLIPEKEIAKKFSVR